VIRSGLVSTVGGEAVGRQSASKGEIQGRGQPETNAEMVQGETDAETNAETDGTKKTKKTKAHSALRLHSALNLIACTPSTAETIRSTQTEESPRKRANRVAAPAPAAATYAPPNPARDEGAKLREGFQTSSLRFGQNTSKGPIVTTTALGRRGARASESAAGLSTPPRSTRAPPIGAHVALCNLKARPELNGKRGKVVEPLTNGRVAVRLAGAHEPILLRVENLIPAAEPQTPIKPMPALDEVMRPYLPPPYP
jgi:hypothetical protein